MSTGARQLHYTYAEYLALEEESSIRHEYLTLHRREPRGWIELEATGGQRVELASVAAHLAVDEVYAAGLEDAGS